MQTNTIKPIVLLFEDFVKRISLSINSDAEDSTKLVTIAESSSCNKSLSRFHYFSHIQRTMKLHKHLQLIVKSFRKIKEGKSNNRLEAWRRIIIGDGSVKRKYRAAATVPNTRTRPCEATSSSCHVRNMSEYVSELS